MTHNESKSDTVSATHTQHGSTVWQQQQQQQQRGYLPHQARNGGVPAASEHLQELQGLQEDASGQLDDPWSREAGPEDGMPVLAEETFMQHVTRVYKVNKHVWDFYSQLTVQQAVRISGISTGGAAQAAQQQGPVNSGWMDPSTFRFRSTWEDVPAGVLPSLSTMSRPFPAASNGTPSAPRSLRALAAASRPLAAAAAADADSAVGYSSKAANRSLHAVSLPVTAAVHGAAPTASSGWRFGRAAFSPTPAAAGYENGASQSTYREPNLERPSSMAAAAAAGWASRRATAAGGANGTAAAYKDFSSAAPIGGPGCATLTASLALPSLTEWRQQQQLDKSSKAGSTVRRGVSSSGSSTAGSEAAASAGQVVMQLRLRPSIFLLPVLSPEHRLAWLWSLLMLFMDMVYVAFIMPTSMAFCPVVFGQLNWCGAVDLAAGVIYIVNFLMSFQIGFILEHDYKKRLLVDGLHVARFYVLRGSFLTDMLAVLPVMYQIVMVSGRIANYWANRCLTFTMLLRLLRLAQLMKVLFVDSLITSGSSGLSRYVSVLGQYALIALYAAAVLVHNLACLAWLVALMEGPEHSWAAQVGWASQGPGSLPYCQPAEQYLAGLYWVFTTVTTTGYGDILPTTPLEVMLALLFMLFGVSMVALLIGSMTELLTQATSDARRAHALPQKMTEVDEWVQRRNIPSKLAKAITNYYNQVWLRHQEHPTEAAILSELPTSLRGRVATHITQGLLDGLPLMQGLDNAAREDLASRLVPVEVAPGHELCREGDEADCLWLLQEGELLCSRGNKQVELLAPPHLLGEYCLLSSEFPQLCYRPATLRALSSCQLWLLSLRELNTLIVHHPALAERLQAAAQQYVAAHTYLLAGSRRSFGSTQQQQQYGPGQIRVPEQSKPAAATPPGDVAAAEPPLRARLRQLAARSVPIRAAAAGRLPAAAGASAASGFTAGSNRDAVWLPHAFSGVRKASLAARSVPAASVVRSTASALEPRFATVNGSNSGSRMVDRTCPVNVAVGDSATSAASESAASSMHGGQMSSMTPDSVWCSAAAVSLPSVVRADADADVLALGFVPDQQQQQQLQQQQGRLQQPALQQLVGRYIAPTSSNVMDASSVTKGRPDMMLSEDLQAGAAPLSPFQQPQPQLQPQQSSAAALPFRSSSSTGQLQQISELASLDVSAAPRLASAAAAAAEYQQRNMQQ